MAILVTGGAGFIGSHTVVELQNAGYDVVVVDNLVNASKEALRRVEEITGKPVTFYEADILDRDAMEKVFTENEIECDPFCRTEGGQRIRSEAMAVLL